MSNHHLHTLTGLAVVPRFAQFRFDVARQDSNTDAFALQDALQPAGHVAGAGVTANI
ncbi:MAG TPA: hypothetical protein VMT20_27960 [Terriglobia bacterium]|nr:hypothetical protein [Terriglobia bacterium]